MIMQCNERKNKNWAQKQIVIERERERNMDAYAKEEKK